MAKERERKFLVHKDSWRGAAESASAIRQFDLLAEADRSLRVRLEHDHALKLKLGEAARERDEHEFPLPQEDARKMERSSVGAGVEKTPSVSTPAAVEAFRAFPVGREKALRKTCSRRAAGLLGGTSKKPAAHMEQKMRYAA